MKKTIFVLTLIFLLSSFLTVGAMALEGRGESVREHTAEEVKPEEISPDEDYKNNENGYTGARETEKSAPSVYEVIMDNLSEIFSILTFVISLILTWFYKKGAVLEDSSVNTVKAHAENAVKSIDDKIESAETVIKAFSTIVVEIDKKLDRVCEEYGCRESAIMKVKVEVEELCRLFSDGAFADMSADDIREKLDLIKKKLCEEIDT